MQLQVDWKGQIVLLLGGADWRRPAGGLRQSEILGGTLPVQG